MSASAHPSHLFLSYAAIDRERVLAIADALEAAGVPVWIDQRGIGGGELWAAEITAAIRACAALMLVCTAASVTSRNVRQELQIAWDHDRPILPLLLEPVQFPDEIAYFLQGRQWIEMREDGPGDWIAEVARFVPAPRPEDPSQQAPLAAPRAVVTNLPVPPTAIIGRNAQIREVRDLLQRQEVQLVTLTGPGGVGKTRLALAVAWRMRETFAGAIYFVDLAPVRDPQLVMPAIAQSVGLKDTGQEPLVSRLHATLRDQPMVLVLDNCEQVLEAAGDIGELMAGLPDLTILATSREPLRLRAERTVDVSPLTVSVSLAPKTAEQAGEIPAVALFVDRASAAKPGFALTSKNSTAIVEICRRLDGLPLAIELAASRSALFPPDLMLKRLEQPLPLLTSGARDLPARQRTLRDAIAWSEDLLSDDERAVLRRLSVFVGGFTLETALAVTDTPGSLSRDVDVLAAMERLVAHSLLRQMVSEEGETRFTMLETIREFALERLEASGEAEEAHQRHASWFLDLAERAAPELTGPEQQEWGRRLEADHDNLRAALTWAVSHDSESALRLCAALHEFWILTSALREGTLWCDRALAAGDAGAPACRANAMYTAARLAYRQGNVAKASDHADTALELFERLGDERGMARAKAALAASRSTSADVATRIALLTEALEIMRRVDDAYYISMCANNLAIAYVEAGNVEVALDLFFESAAMDRRRHDKLTFVLTVANIVEMLVVLGRVDEALPLLREVVEDFRRLRHRANLSHILNSIAMAISARGQAREAVRLYGAADMEIQLTGAFAMGSDDDNIVADRRRLREQLGEAEFDAAWSAGRALSIEAAMDEASAALDDWDAAGNRHQGG
jgi:predicted ATPase